MISVFDREIFQETYIHTYEIISINFNFEAVELNF